MTLECPQVSITAVVFVIDDFFDAFLGSALGSENCFACDSAPSEFGAEFGVMALPVHGISACLRILD